MGITLFWNNSQFPCFHSMWGFEIGDCLIICWIFSRKSASFKNFSSFGMTEAVWPCDWLKWASRSNPNFNFFPEFAHLSFIALLYLQNFSQVLQIAIILFRKIRHVACVLCTLCTCTCTCAMCEKNHGLCFSEASGNINAQTSVRTANSVTEFSGLKKNFFWEKEIII